MHEALGCEFLENKDLFLHMEELESRLGGLQMELGELKQAVKQLLEANKQLSMENRQLRKVLKKETNPHPVSSKESVRAGKSAGAVLGANPARPVGSA